MSRTILATGRIAPRRHAVTITLDRDDVALLLTAVAGQASECRRRGDMRRRDDSTQLTVLAAQRQRTAARLDDIAAQLAASITGEV